MASLKAFADYCILKKPDYIVNLGDVGSFDSVSRYIKDRGFFTTEEELTAVKQAYTDFFNTFERYNKNRRKMHEKLYKPHFTLCLGNHDVRTSEIEEDLVDFFTGFHCDVTYYKEYCNICDILFSHSFVCGRSGSVCSNTDDILTNTLHSSVSAHGHVRELSETKTILGERIAALRTPCLNCDSPAWAGETSKKWDRGWLELYVDANKIKGFIFRDL